MAFEISMPEDLRSKMDSPLSLQDVDSSGAPATARRYELPRVRARRTEVLVQAPWTNSFYLFIVVCLVMLVLKLLVMSLAENI
jgi:hypothetical protein